MSVSVVILYALRGVILLVFLFLGWREIRMLLSRPGPTLGAGLSRVWAVARTTIFEAWAGRVWLLPVLWIILSTILIGTVRPFDDSERIPLYIRMLLWSQEILLIVMLWVMACISLPRERDRKTLITTASKPLSRLEIILGKMTGFSVVAGASLLLMGLLSLGFLYLADHRIRAQAAEHYEIQRRDFARTLRTPQENLLQIAEQGSLFAYNYITVPPEGMSILGLIDNSTSPPSRYIKGGSYQKIICRFSPNLIAPIQSALRPPGFRPFFVFNLPQHRQFVLDTPIQIRVTAMRTSYRTTRPPRPIEKTLMLDPRGFAVWELEEEDMDEIYSFVDENTAEQLDDKGEVTIEILCTTPNAMLRVWEGAVPDPVTGQLPPGTEFNVVFVPYRDQPLQALPMPHPIVRGFERRDRQEVAGPRPGERSVPGLAFYIYEQGVFRFPGSALRRVHLDEKREFTLSVNFQTYRSENPGIATRAVIKVYSTDNRANQFTADIEVLEKRTRTLRVPEEYLGDPDPDKRGDLIVSVYCPTEGHSLSMLEDSIRIELPETPFFVNLFKSQAVLFLEAMLVLVIAVTCSVRFGWPVAMLLSGVCMGFGFFAQFIIGIQEYGGLGALNFQHSGEQSLAFRFLDQVTSGIWRVLAAIASILPDFSIFRVQDFLPNFQNMPWSVLGVTFLDTCTFALPFIALAFLMFRKQEIG